MKLLSNLFVIILLTLSFNASAQTVGQITGKVTMVDGKPLASASISIVNSVKSTLTNDTGRYNFNNIATGSYTIKIQILGAPEVDLKANVIAGQTDTLNYQFKKENVLALQEVAIEDKNSKFANKESIYVARLPLKNIENPQVYNVVPKELLEEQMAVSLNDVGKDIPGAGIPMIANQGRVTFFSRGFETEPNARNGVAGAAFSEIDNANLERVEAIKGPSATLFGTNISSSFGGLFNRVTKEPYNGSGGEVAYYGGSWDYNRITFDVNTPANADKTALFRLDGATTFQRSFQDQGFDNNFSLAPSFFYQVTDRLSLKVEAEFEQANATSVVRFQPFTGGTNTGAKSIADMQFPYNKNFMGNDLDYTTQMLNLFAHLNYKISAGWNSQTIISRARSTINGDITALAGKTDSTITPQVITGNTEFIATDLQQNFIGDFKIGSHRNRVVIGVDFYHNFNDFDRTTVNPPVENFIHPSATYRISQFKIDSLTSKGTLRKEYNSDDTYAAYVSDVFNITDRLLAMASLRIDRYQYNGVYNITTGITAGGIGAGGVQAGPYGQTALSPKMGLVYEVIKDRLSLFGNYMNGFFNQSGVAANGDLITPIKPESGNQIEFGTKADLFDHRLVGTVSYYDISISNVIRPDPNNAQYAIQNGTQLSKGVEVDITANPIDGLNIVAGYAYNDSKLTKADSTVNGLRPAQSGPPNMVNLWMSYTIIHGNLKGLGIGFGGNYGSSSYYYNTYKYQIIIPKYTSLDGSIFYDQRKYRIGIKVNNITSEKMWSSRLTPQAPATFIGSLALKF